MGRTLGPESPFPPAAFLQATRDGEDALVAAARRWAAGASRVADLFAGLGTFAFALDARVTAFEAARDAFVSCAAAAGQTRNVEAVHRDLYRAPLTADELDPFDAVVLDPPRAGAAEQVARLAKSRVPKVVHASCNPATFARDAATLVDGGYRLREVRPIGQFRWSTHVELVALFERV